MVKYRKMKKSKLLKIESKYMFRHRILVQNASKIPVEPISYHITKRKQQKQHFLKNQKILSNRDFGQNSKPK